MSKCKCQIPNTDLNGKCFKCGFPAIDPTIEQMNVIIARFEGRKFYGRHTIDKYGEGTGNALPEMKYHTSWDWLMPIVEKIRKLATSGDAINGITENTIFSFSIFAPLKDVHLAVYQFITWYNNQQTTTNES